MSTIFTSSRKSIAAAVAALTMVGVSVSLSTGAEKAFAANNNCGTEVGMSFEVQRVPTSSENQEYLFYAANTSWTFTRVSDGTTVTVKDNVTSLVDRHDHNLNAGRFCFVNDTNADTFFVEGEQYTIKQEAVTEGFEPATIGLVESSYATVPDASWARLDKTAVPFTWAPGGNLNNALLESLNQTVNDADNYYVLETNQSSITWYVETEDGERTAGTVWNVYPDDDKYDPYDASNFFTVTDNDGQYDTNPEDGVITLAYPTIRSFYKVYIGQVGGAPNGYLVADEDPAESFDSDNDGYGTAGVSNWGNEHPADHLTFVMKKARSVTYDGNGAVSGEVAETHGVLGSQTTVAENAFARDGFTFTEWNTAADGSGDSYKPGDALTFGETPITLYAQWDEVAVTPEPEPEPEPTVPPVVTETPAQGGSAAAISVTPSAAAPATTLATTGSNVVAIAVAAAVLLTSGLVLAVKRRA